MQPLTATTPFRSGHGLAVAVTFLLATNMALSVLGVLATTAKIASGAAEHLGGEDEVSIFVFIDLGLALLYFVAYITTVVLFCVWLHRAAANLPALSNPKSAIKHSPGWAVGSFFVPFANLVIPFRAVRETWDKSDPAVPFENYVSPAEPSAPPIMSLWWAFWLISNFVNNAAFRLSLNAKTSEQLYVATWFDLAGDVLNIFAALFAIFVVRDIDRRQEERSKRVVYTTLVPPPPLY
jgi:hypothetical protein